MGCYYRNWMHTLPAWDIVPPKCCPLSWQWCTSILVCLCVHVSLCEYMGMFMCMQCYSVVAIGLVSPGQRCTVESMMARRWPSSHSRMTTGDCSTSWLRPLWWRISATHTWSSWLEWVWMRSQCSSSQSSWRRGHWWCTWGHRSGASSRSWTSLGLRETWQMGWPTWSTKTWFTGGRVICSVAAFDCVPALNQGTLLPVDEIYVVCTCGNQGLSAHAECMQIYSHTCMRIIRTVV